MISSSDLPCRLPYQLPHVKLGKFVRFDQRLVREFLARRTRTAWTSCEQSGHRYNGERAKPQGAIERNGYFSMTRSKRQYGSGCLIKRGTVYAIRWRGIPDVTWLTCRRTYSSWSHAMGVPGKVIAQLMGHATIDTTLNVYTQVSEG